MKQPSAMSPGPGSDKQAHATSQRKTMTHSQHSDKGPLVVLMILAGDIITIAFVLLWLLRWR
jgi:hypothetical protein